MSYLNEIEKRLDLPPATKQQVLRELASHFAELKAELVESGMEPPQAEREAEKRLGEPADVAARLNAAHNSASWKSALLCAVPFVASITCSALPWPQVRTPVAVAFTALFAAASIRELIKGRRPVWLAPWLAGAMYFSASQVFSVPIIVDNPPSFGASRAMFVLGGILAALSLVAAWRVHVWQRPVLMYSLIVVVIGAFAVIRSEASVAGSLGVVLMLGALAWYPCVVVLLVYFTRCVLEMHPYGNAMQASLFLLAVLTLEVSGTTSGAVAPAAGELLCAGAIVWMVRAPLRRDKCKAMWAALFLWGLGSPIVSLLPDVTFARLVLAAVSAAVSACIAYFVVSIPIRGEYRPRPNSPFIAS